MWKSLEVQDHTAPNWKTPSGGKYEQRGLSCDKTANISLDIMESTNLLHKLGFVSSLNVSRHYK